MNTRFRWFAISLLAGLMQPAYAERVFDFAYQFYTGPEIHGSVKGDLGSDQCGAYVYNVTVLDAFYSDFYVPELPLNLPLTLAGYPAPNPDRMYFYLYCNNFRLTGGTDNFHLTQLTPSQELLAAYHRRATPEQPEIWARDWSMFGSWRLSERIIPVDELLTALHQRVIGVGPGRSLANKILHVQAYYDAQDYSATCEMLAAFVNEVGAQTAKKIERGLAMSLMQDASEIQARIGCE